MGGNTAFLDLEESEKIEVEPRTGMLILKYKFDLTYYANSTIKKNDQSMWNRNQRRIYYHK